MYQFEESMERIKAKLDAKEEIVLIDVREQEEYDSGHLPTARLYPLSMLAQQVETLPKDSKLYVYCHSGQRANAAVRILQESGFTQVENIGGVIHWKFAFE